MPDLPKREDVETSVRRNFNASLLDQLVGLETDKALLQEELKQALAQNAQLTRLVNALQAKLQKLRPPAAIEPVPEAEVVEKPPEIRIESAEDPSQFVTVGPPRRKTRPQAEAAE